MIRTLLSYGPAWRKKFTGHSASLGPARHMWTSQVRGSPEKLPLNIVKLGPRTALTRVGALRRKPSSILLNGSDDRGRVRRQRGSYGEPGVRN